MARSTDPPACAILLDRGGYMVHPVPAPLSTPADANRSINEGGTNQKLILFIRGKAISGAPIIRGISQFPKPPIIIGITMKNIMTRACAVTTVLYIWSSFRRDPGCASSARIITLMAVPIIPAQAPKSK